MANRALIFATVVFGSLAMACNSYASILTNGDFETTDGSIGIVANTPLYLLGTPGKAKWDVYKSIPGWYTPAGHGPGIEIQTDGTVVNGHSSNHYVELDSHSGSDTNSAMVQNVLFDLAGTYSLSYYFHARTSSVGDNGINVFFDDAVDGILGNLSDLVGASNIDDPSLGWIEQTILLENVTAGTHQIKFWATGTDNSLGGFLDDVSLVRVGSIDPVSLTAPEPAAVAVWSVLCVFGLAMIRRRRRTRAGI